MEGIEKIMITVLAVMLVSVKRRLPETRRLSSGITALSLAGIVLLAAAGSASALPACPAPGDTVITASCELDQNWNVPAGQAGYIIGADGVTIDGAGYKITGSVTVTDCAWAGETAPCTVSGIRVDGPTQYNADVVIKNLEITGFCTGIALGGGTSPAQRIDNVTIDNCEIHHNGFNNGDSVTQGIHVCGLAEGAEGAPALTIVNNDIHHNEGTGSGCGAGGNGIFIYGGSPDAKHEYCNISYNDLHHNAKSGFWTKMMLSKCDITHNNATENGGGAGIGDDVQGGIILRCKKSNYNFIAYNNASNNGGATNYGYGIYVGGSNNTIWDNTVRNNTADGICMCRSDGSDYNNVSNNTACRNGKADIGTCGGAGPDGCCGNYGDGNICDVLRDCDGCNDIKCPYHCPDTLEVELKVGDVYGTWNTINVDYTVTYTVENNGESTSNVTHAGIRIDGELVDVQYVPAIIGHGSHTNTSGPHPVNSSVSVNGATYIDNVTVCADIYNEETREDDENNNCEHNNFGGPDLKIYPQYYVEWIDLSRKTYNLSYTVKNVGDIATTHPVWVNFTEIDCEWKDCVDPNPIPAGLQPGETTELRTVGPFVMGGDSNWVEDWVNFNYSCPVNHWDVAHHDRDRFTEGYGGDCKECGDVNCKDDVDANDGIDLLKHVANPGVYPLTCNWAGDVNCKDDVDANDGIDLLKHVANPGVYPLDCCEGCTP